MKTTKIILISICLEALVACKVEKNRNNISQTLDSITNKQNVSNLDTIRKTGREDNSDTIHCNVKTVLYTVEKMEELTINDIDNFLLTFCESCSNNVEFLEFSNEILFEILKKYPLETLKLLEENKTKYDFKSIYKQLQFPLHDLIPIEEIRKKIEKQEMKGERVDSVINALKIAHDNF